MLSRAHAKILFEDGKFYLFDTGSSNGSFVNNIRLSKCGEESKVTQIYTGDLIRSVILKYDIAGCSLLLRRSSCISHMSTP